MLYRFMNPRPLSTLLVQPVVLLVVFLSRAAHHLHLFLKLSVFFQSKDAASAHGCLCRAWAGKQTLRVQSGLSALEFSGAWILFWRSTSFSHFRPFQATVTQHSSVPLLVTDSNAAQSLHRKRFGFH